MLSVGLPMAFAYLFTEAVNNLDYVVVGRVLDRPLGLYLMAFNLSSWPVTTLSISISRVSVPGFAGLSATTPSKPPSRGCSPAGGG